MPKAKYVEIYKDLKMKIETGTYEFQELLPSENQLILTYDCSRNTVRRAISALVTDGYVQTAQGKGVRNIFALPCAPPLPSAESNLLKNPLSETARFPKQRFYALRRSPRTRRYPAEPAFPPALNCITCSGSITWTEKLLLLITTIS